jgi:hypothetical protein
MIQQAHDQVRAIEQTMGALKKDTDQSAKLQAERVAA